MGNKANPKQFALLCRKLVVLSDLFTDTLEEIEKHGPQEEEFKAHLDAIKERCEATLTAAYGVDSVMNSTYIGDLSKKVDTLIRKNFEIDDVKSDREDDPSAPWNLRK